MKIEKEKYKYVRTEYTENANKFAEMMINVTTKFDDFVRAFARLNSFESSNYGQLIALNAVESFVEVGKGLHPVTVQIIRAAILDSAMAGLEKIAPGWELMGAKLSELSAEIAKASDQLRKTKVMLDAEHCAAANFKPKK